MAASVLEVLITGDATSLKLAFTQATAATEGYVASTQSASAATKEATASSTAFGNAASKAMTYAKLGALAFAAVSVKAAIDFNREFTLIAAVTNTAADRLDGLKSTVMDLSHETGIAPTELAHSLYFLASAGLTTEQQMTALEASAKGAAIGLGTAGDLARIEANALNAFSDQGLTASQVMDTLTAAIREGTAEPDEFATALGRVLPIADNAGISFQQVAASLATMSNAGLDVNEGVTALRAMLQSLVAPTAQTTSAFQTMGLSVTDVVASMKGQGLIATLRLVSDRAKQVTDSTGEYNQLMRHSIPNIRGLAGALNLTQQQAAKVDGIFQRITNSTGDMNQAFQTTAESDAFKVTQAINDIKIAGQNLAADVLPLLAGALEFAAQHADFLLKALLAYAGLKFVAPLLRSIAAANMELAASEVAAATAQGSVAGLNFGGMKQFGQIGPASSVAARSFGVEAQAAAAGAFKLNSQAAGAMGSVARLGNSLETSAIPQLAQFVVAAQDAQNSLRAFQQGGITSLLKSFAGSGTAGTISTFFGQSLGLQFFKDMMGPSSEAIQHLKDGLASVDTALQATGKTAEEQKQIFQSALQSVGGSINTENIDQFAQAVQGQLDQEAQAKAAAEQQKAAMLELTKQTQAADEATMSWQKSTAQMTDHLTGLSRIGIDVNAFMSQLQTDLAGSDDQAKTFTDAIDQVSQAWMDFKDNAQQALFFIPQALSDATAAAQQAQDQLDSMTKSTSLTNNEVAALQDTANLTAGDILQTFQDANAQSREFFKNLKEIANIGGKAGKDLAASLLQSGNTTAAAIIAGAGDKMQKQIAGAFGTGEDMADKFATKLTNAIVGPLDTITGILAKIARQAFGIKLHLDDGGAKKKTKDIQNQVDDLTKQKHRLVLEAVDSGTKQYLADRQAQVNELTGHKHSVNVYANTDPAKAALQTFEDNLSRLTSRKYNVDVGVHTHGDSPMPDEALKMHLFDPMKQAGFKRVGDTYTLPLVVGAHTEATAPDGGGGRQGGSFGALLKVEARQLGVLFDIRRELKHGVGGGSGGSGSSSGGSSGSGSSSTGSSSDFPKEIERQLKDFRLYISSVRSNAAAKRWSSAIADAISSGDMAREAKLLHQAMRDMAEVTNQKEAAKAFHDFQGAVQDFERAQNQEAMKQHMADALAFATHNVPRLPRGHTNISVNHHERHRRQVTLNMDRKRFTDAASYDVDYARGF